MRDLFQGQPPPPGAISVLGRSLASAFENGFGNSLAMLIAANDRNVRQEIGMTDAEANAVQLLQVQMLMNAPKYAARFKTMTEADQKGIQEDIERELGKITEYFDKSLEPERKEKVQKFIFQSLGGVDSPMIGIDAMEALNLSDDQRKKLQTVFDDMKEERMAHMEAMLKMAEKAVAIGGPQNFTQEDREQLREEGEKLQQQVLATSKKLTERLRQHLTAEQLEQEKHLLATRPAFLPRLPDQPQPQPQPQDEPGKGYVPGADSWQPGQDLPVQPPVQSSGGLFPRTEVE
jgi:Spy/CpxP family protein refolding chaperone